MADRLNEREAVNIATISIGLILIMALGYAAFSLVRSTQNTRRSDKADALFKKENEQKVSRSDEEYRKIIEKSKSEYNSVIEKAKSETQTPP